MDEQRTRARGGASVVLLERSATFQPDLRSAQQARRMLGEVLAAVDRGGWEDAGALALSEVVTNAALHAHTPVDVRVQVHPDHLHVEVHDRNPVLPARRQYDDHATTGRGMALVAALTTECGVQSLGEDGKVVWFRLGDAPDERSEEDLLAAWDLDDEDVEPRVDCHTVVLPSMPATLWLAARQHHDALLRELVLYRAEHTDVDVDLAAADRARSTIIGALLAALEHARESGTARPALPYGHPSPLPWVPPHLDLEVSVPADIAPGFSALQEALDEGERLAAEGKLLVHPGLPEIIAVRDWAAEQVVAQLGGAPPSPWPGTAQERFETEVHEREAGAPGGADPAWDPRTVQDADRGVVAADDANRIVAVSRSLAGRLGWDVDDLVGRRVVTLIPRPLREAHVAGFSRHLSTGEAHILGVPLRLPVLHRDGTTSDFSFLVERAPTSGGRSVYLAWMEPAEPA